MYSSPDYLERVYAGVLGKIIGVYLGRPFEGWTRQRILSELGEIWDYQHERLGVPLVVADDDISGTFTFLRALPDHGGSADLTAEQIGNSWLNYIVENRSILWWGGMGNSTEHTAFLRLKSGVPAPQSGAMATNGKTVAEQIGAQIFIDGWALVCPGNPGLAVEFARKAGSVSHDGEAIYASQLLAAMEAQAFVEPGIDQLIETGLKYLPADCLVTRLVNDVRNWHRADNDWGLTRDRIEHQYGYDKFPGNCHVIPNHAIIILSLLYSQDDFSRALMIANTSGWDTDCNSGNVGCLIGIKNGLAAIPKKLREPVADKLYLSTADGGRCITDAVRESYEICRIAHQLGQAQPIPTPKNGARFHFSLAGSVQGFSPGGCLACEAQAVTTDFDQARAIHVENVELTEQGVSPVGLASEARSTGGAPRMLVLDFTPSRQLPRIRITTPTFIPPDSKEASHYSLMACPTLYSGNIVTGRLVAAAENSAKVRVTPFVAYYGDNDELTPRHGPELTLDPGSVRHFEWKIDELCGAPIAQFGLEVTSESEAAGRLYVDYIDWSGTPTTVFRRPPGDSKMWLRAWVNAVDHVGTRWASPFHLSQNRGTGLFIQGSRDWQNYSVQSAIMSDPAKSFGLAARVQGLTRYYALLLGPNQLLRLIRNYDEIQVLAETPYTWNWSERYRFNLEVSGSEIIGSLNGTELIRYNDSGSPLVDGGIALVCEEGLIMTDEVSVTGA
ncbi:MAG: ADP-ribosylglycohydrolase family protein [Verrucomicrobia bacterium]|nr:ADP-ribosylglycohydrolase family protein [Verrucomicrobiota bacterium]MBV8484762.1 ADP-ribosylglycohydrolase family protein [Verrucomicrobiota bacterium]